MVILGGFFNVFVSKNSRNSDENFCLQPSYVSIYGQDVGKESPGASLFASSTPSCFLFLSFYYSSAPNRLKILLFTVVLQVVLSFNPSFRKGVFLVF